MYQIGLLLLTGPFRVVVESISQYLKCANKNIIKRLYVKIEADISRPFTKSDRVNLNSLSYFVPLVYNKASSLCANLDIRILLSDTRKRKTELDEPSKVDVILTDSTEENQNIINYTDHFLKRKCTTIIKLHEKELGQSNSLNNNELPPEFKIFKTVCLGGTFDRLHNGHKVLLSEAALRATEKLIVGVTDGPMLKRKVLWELIEPIQKRIADITEFLLDIDPSLHYEVVPITDPYGPTITNPDIDCIVVSAETKVGGTKVNAERKNRGMSELTMYVVDLVENAYRTPIEEQKLSSSSKRINVLGTCLKTPEVTSKEFYTILLQGLPFTGKSYISTCFENFGAIVIHSADIITSILNFNEDLKKAFCDKFENKLGKDNEEVDLKKLKCLCLKNKDIRQWVAEHLSEKVNEEIKQKIQIHHKKGVKLILIQDSILLNGNLKCDGINELWTTIMPVSEVAKRLGDFCHLSENDATNVAKSLPNNECYIDKFHRIFCFQWSKDISDQQISRVWSDIKTRML